MAATTALSLLTPPLKFPLTKTPPIWLNTRKLGPTRIAAGDGGGGGGGAGEDDSPAFNPFGFVTDNPSSRSAIQLPESPAEDGNVGQMLYRIEDKGKEYGRYIKSGELVWFVRETGSPDSRRGTIVFLHGAPTQSYSYRNVMSQMSDAGFHCIAPDWIGFGFSDKPYPKFGFDYTEKEFHDELDKLLGVLGVKDPFLLVVQGFLVGSYGLTWALKNANRISKLVIMNSPLTASSPLPGLFQQLRIPLLGEFTSQNAIIAERFIEGGSAYVLKLEKADVYRLPYLSSSGPGFALLEAARRINFREVSTQIATGFASGRKDFNKDMKTSAPSSSRGDVLLVSNKGKGKWKRKATEAPKATTKAPAPKAQKGKGKQVVTNTPTPKARQPVPTDVCIYCSNVGHWKRDCPKFVEDKKAGRVPT